MKIGIICHDAFPITQPFQGGLEMITFLIVEELHHRGHEVTSLCLKGSTLSGSMVYYEEIESAEDNLEYQLEEVAAVSKSLNNFLLQDFDVVQNHSLHYQSIILGNISHHNFITTFHTPVFSFLRVAIDVVASNVRQQFIGVSDCISDLYGKTLPKVNTIHNGIDLSIWKPKLKVTDDFYYSWSGRICKEKGLAKLMGLCLKVDITLKIAGPISDTDYFESQIKPLLALDNFEYVGHLHQKELNEFIKNSRGYIFSSIWEEPYGLVIAEALACGVPVLANNVGAAPEILDSKSGFLFDIKKLESFKQGLNYIDSLSRKDCRNRAESFCSHHSMVDKYEALYAQMSAKYLEKAV
jgi:UDP-glucose:tetrahydrobiopterin glucosyltransferase